MAKHGLTQESAEWSGPALLALSPALPSSSVRRQYKRHVPSVSREWTLASRTPESTFTNTEVSKSSLTLRLGCK